MLHAHDIAAIVLTLQLAAVSTVILLILGTPLAWWLAHSHNRAKPLFEAIVALPLVLPPTVLGFYLLLAFAPDSPFGQLWLSATGHSLAFSFSALVIGSVLYSLPFVVQPLQASFEQLPVKLLEAASTLGADFKDRFFSIVLPLSRRSFITAASLGFAHTVGEFGIVLMIGGNIPGKTQVLSIALFDRVESLQFQQAHILAAGLVVFSLLLLTVVYRINKPTVLTAARQS
ncbi:molybdate ABC transporter permease subunit [Dasania sp. GY-MA-18]|uniref:Molybdenum transport system permease n=1 Tax=Dasania phycosphaerae TaxID=2950436 RepID=A0A9J6RJF2_9GAMM|nr:MULTISPECIES: molybdate ABC transporter permease subunit [Dasania]MCR8922402.1 molybdate ABC transporter permease subunit [Dasania sp. GY-MA-18]MCZ0864830.1 molybdate ABC transporter permease subunit [Dasania phycosphaerae]MCZ0868558.1 molybdate ABC transporter permease subunit [Dasania phycosphaerae]